MKQGKLGMRVRVWVGLFFTTASIHAAITLPGWNSAYLNYVGDVGFSSADGSGGLDQTVFTDSTIYDVNMSNVSNPSPASADALTLLASPTAPRSNGTYSEDTWGVGLITEIYVSGPNNLGLPNNTVLWLPNATNELTFTFYGVLDEKVQIGSNGSGNIASMGMPASSNYVGGAYVDFFYHAPSFFNAVTNGPAGRGGGAGVQPLTQSNVMYPGVTDGTHWLSLQLMTGADDFKTSNTVLRSTVSGASPYASTDYSFADVSSNGLFGVGADNANFAASQQPTQISNPAYRNFSITVPVYGAGTNQTAVPYGWTTQNLNATATLLTNVIPEPTTGALVTFALALVGFPIRKRRR